jgi:hypothetical protein
MNRVDLDVVDGPDLDLLVLIYRVAVAAECEVELAVKEWRRKGQVCRFR